MDYTRPHSVPRLLCLGIALIGIALCLGIGIRRGPDRLAPEGLVRETIGQQLCANTTAGRQALISSARWTPLPTLLRLPGTYLLGPEWSGIPSLLVSSLCGIALVWVLYVILGRWQLGWVRWAILAGFMAHPQFSRSCCDGSSTTTVALLVLVTAFGLVLWDEEQKLRGLAFFGLGAALLLLTSFEMTLWLAFLVLLFVWRACRLTAPRPQQPEAILILGLWPAVYAGGLWLLANWLIMGDGLYFLRFLWCTPDPLVRVVAVQPESWPASGGAVILAALLMWAAVYRRSQGILIALAGLGVTGAALLLNHAGYLWDADAVLFSGMPLSAMAAGCLYRDLTADRPRWKILPVCLVVTPLLTAVALYLMGAVPSTVPSAQAVAEERRILPAIRREMRSTAAVTRVFVCGFDGYRLCGARPDPLFLATLDFDLYQTMEQYRGYHLFVLVPRPGGPRAAESIHWKYPNLYYRGYSNLLYFKDWGDWRMFEIIQPPRKETRP